MWLLFQTKGLHADWSDGLYSINEPTLGLDQYCQEVFGSSAEADTWDSSDFNSNNDQPYSTAKYTVSSNQINEYDTVGRKRERSFFVMEWHFIFTLPLGYYVCFRLQYLELDHIFKLLSLPLHHE